MSSEKHRQLVDQLLVKTKVGQLEWRETAEPDTFQVSFPNYSVMITQQRHNPRFPIHIVSILNSGGRRVDTFSDESAAWEASDKPQLTELYQHARRQALGADKALEDILNALKDPR